MDSAEAVIVTLPLSSVVKVKDNPVSDTLPTPGLPIIMLEFFEAETAPS
jgi:hypothetical protein